MDDNKILADLPDALKVDVMMARHREALLSSAFFKDKRQKIDKRIAQSFFKFSHSQIFLPGQDLLTAGRSHTDVCVILEGEVHCIGFDNTKVCKAVTGEFYGGILENSKAYWTIRAVNTCKIARIRSEHFDMLANAFPDWALKMRTRETARKKQTLAKLDFFRRSERESAQPDEDDDDRNDFGPGPQARDIWELTVTEDLINYYANHDIQIPSRELNERSPKTCGSQNIQALSENSKSLQNLDPRSESEIKSEPEVRIRAELQLAADKSPQSSTSKTNCVISERPSDKSEFKTDKSVTKHETGPTYDQTLIREQQRPGSQGLSALPRVDSMDGPASMDTITSRSNLVTRCNQLPPSDVL